MFIVIEIQNDNGSIAHLFDAFEDRAQAKSKYHTILAAAAVSKLSVHSALLCTDEGYVLESECYKHGEEEDES